MAEQFWPGNLGELAIRVRVAAYMSVMVNSLATGEDLSVVNTAITSEFFEGMAEVTSQLPVEALNANVEYASSLRTQMALIISNNGKQLYSAQHCADKAVEILFALTFLDWDEAGGSNVLAGGPPTMELREYLISAYSAYVDGVLMHHSDYLFGSGQRIPPSFEVDMTGEVIDPGALGSS